MPCPTAKHDTTPMTASATPATPLTLLPPPTPRQHLTRQVKRLALEHGLTVSAVTSAESFPEVFAVLRDRIAAGHLTGMDWFTTERAAASCEPRTLMAEPRVDPLRWRRLLGQRRRGSRTTACRAGGSAATPAGVDYHEILPRPDARAARGHRRVRRPSGRVLGS